MKIALGTKSPQKREFLEEILNELRIVADIEPIEVSSGVSDQPLTSKETKQGSINRAKKALQQLPNADFSLGIEVGYHPNKQGNYEMLCWTTLINNQKFQISKNSEKIILPSFHQQILKANNNVGMYVNQYLIENNDPFSQYIGIVIRDRKPFIQNSIKLVLLNYFVK